ncbi:HAD family phosphatase [Candidatus Nomurabacteria bacterium]|nr:HAD family phosphatase [Candidatus Nomurabacteria bacterium]
MQKVAFLDLDGTVTPDSTWFLLNTRLGITPEEDSALFERYLKSEVVSYEEWIAELVRLYRSRGSVTKEELETWVAGISLRDGAGEMVTSLREKGYTVVLLSGSVDLVVEAIAKRIGVDDWRALSRLVFSDNGTLTDIVSSGDESNAKSVVARAYLSERGLAADDALAIGDGGNDIDLFKVVKGIALGRNEKLGAVAYQKVESLSDIAALI